MNSKLSMQVFGVYLVVVVGIGLIFFPSTLLGIFGLNAGDDAWIRMVGLLGSILGAYYIIAASSGADVLYRWSIPLRIYAAVFMVLMFVTGLLSVGILLIAAGDAAGALWTWAALRAERRLDAQT